MFPIIVGICNIVAAGWIAWLALHPDNCMPWRENKGLIILAGLIALANVVMGLFFIAIS